MFSTTWKIHKIHKISTNLTKISITVSLSKANAESFILFHIYYSMLLIHWLSELLDLDFCTKYYVTSPQKLPLFFLQKEIKRDNNPLSSLLDNSICV